LSRSVDYPAGRHPPAKLSRASVGQMRNVAESQQRWREVRDGLKHRRYQFVGEAGGLYPDVPRVEETGLLCRPGWIPDAPVELDHVRLRWVEPPPDSAITASGSESAAVRPLADAGGRFETYADAVDVLDRPALFENRSIYRLLAANFGNGGGWLELTSGRYFGAISVAEALGHEFAAARVRGRPRPRPAGQYERIAATGRDR
jgi:hypothetical protein